LIQLIAHVLPREKTPVHRNLLSVVFDHPELSDGFQRILKINVKDVVEGCPRREESVPKRGMEEARRWR
jgi:hypothetical protein